jgi:hypothetical protein
VKYVNFVGKINGADGDLGDRPKAYGVKNLSLLDRTAKIKIR